MESPEASRLSEGDISLLLSPTKARQAAAEFASWKYVDDHLKALFAPNKVPRFERNDATLNALLDLVRANEDVDEERSILHEARLEALSKAQDGEKKRKGTLSQKVLAHLEESLPAAGKTALDDLAASAVLLSCRNGSIEEMEQRILELTRDTFDSENELLSLQQTQRAFERDWVQLQDTIARFKAQTDSEVSKLEEMQTQTQSMNRETKVVGMKLAEYQDRVRALQNYDIGPVGIEDIVMREKELERKQRELKELEERVVALHGLPPDLDVSRKEVERARNELGEWKRKRDRAFEDLAG